MTISAPTSSGSDHAFRPATSRTSSPVRRRARRRRGLVAWLYLLPALVLYAAVVISPSLKSVWYSLYRWDGVSAARWVGLGNYVDFFSDPLFRQALGNAGVLVIFYAVLPIVLGLLSAALLARRRRRGQAFFRWFLFMPQVLTSVVVAVVWKQLYAPDGLINTSLEAVGLGALAQNWLGSFTLALPALGLVGTWVTFGLCMVLFIAGTAGIPSDLYDAARVDGCGPVREFFTVTLPGLRPQLAVAMTLTVIGALRTFDLIWLTTRGGPGTSTITPAVLLYSRAFVEQDVGSGAAVGVVLAVASLLISWLIIRFSERG